MNTKSNHDSCQLRLVWIVLILLLALTAWTSRYWLNGEFGLYEDDLTFLPEAIEADFGEVMEMVSGYFSTLDEQGRPLMWSWVVLFGHLGWQLGGLQGMYVLGFIIWLINILMFVFLLWRIHRQFLFIIIGGFAYVLFAADTNQAFLFNAFGLQTALFLLLIALHLYLIKNHWRWLAYVFLTLVLFNYETPFWLFLAAPLLAEDRGKSLTRRLVVNTLIVAAIFLAVYLLRLSVGESRVAGMSLADMVITPLKHMLIGPLVGLGAYGLRPFQVLRSPSFRLIFTALLSSGIFLLIFIGVTRRMKTLASKLFSFKKGWWNRLDERTQRELSLLIAGMIMLVFAYPLTVILRPYAISGRETRVHMAAVVGAALIVASAMSLLIRASKKKAIRTAILVLFSLVLGFNFAFGFLIQQDYQSAWDLQQGFWRELLPLIQDVTVGTAVLIEPTGLEDVLYINANTWNLPKLLPKMFFFPEEWSPPPRVFRLIEGWQTNIIRIPGYFTLDGSNSFANMVVFGDFNQKNSILITTGNGVLERQFQTTVMGESIQLKPLGQDVLETLDTRPLYKLLMGEY